MEHVGWPSRRNQQILDTDTPGCRLFVHRSIRNSLLPDAYSPQGTAGRNLASGRISHGSGALTGPFAVRESYQRAISESNAGAADGFGNYNLFGRFYARCHERGCPLSPLGIDR